MPNKITTGAIIGDLLKKLDKVRPEIEAGFIGKVMEVTDGVAKVSGLNDLSYSEMVVFANGVLGVAINLEEKQVGVVILGDYLAIKEGDLVRGIDRLLSIGAGEDLIGRVIDPLGNSLDGKGPAKIDKYYPIEKLAPGVVKRQPVSTPLQTGIKAIDSMIPIGRGQRELIIGAREPEKPPITLDTIINKKGKNVVCFYDSMECNGGF